MHGIKNHRPEQHAEQIIDQINQRRSAAVFICPDGRQQYRARCADADTHRNRKRGCKRNPACNRQRLHNTDGSRCALQNGREKNPDQNAHNRIGKHRQRIDKMLVAL